MNRNLFAFAFLLILLGLGFNFYLLAFFGLLMLIPAFLSSTRPRMRPTPTSVKQEPRRITPPLVRQPEVALSQTQPKSTVVAPSAEQPVTYSPSLFPTSMFPAHTQLGTSPQPIRETGAVKPAERDELLEVGTMLILLRLALG